MVDEVEGSEELSMYALVRRLRPGVAQLHVLAMGGSFHTFGSAPEIASRQARTLKVDFGAEL